MSAPLPSQYQFRTPPPENRGSFPPKQPLPTVFAVPNHMPIATSAGVLRVPVPNPAAQQLLTPRVEDGDTSVPHRSPSLSQAPTCFRSIQIRTDSTLLCIYIFSTPPTSFSIQSSTSNMISNMITSILFFISLLSSAAACDRCVHRSIAAYQTSPAALSAGACGYSSMALNFNRGFVVAASPDLYRGGIGCGACYQIRCKTTDICSTAGVKAIVTDLNKSNETDFVLSSRAFAGMARAGMSSKLLNSGTVEVEYKRIPCEYKRNLSIRVEESSRKPGGLVIKFLFQGGQTDIMAVDVARVGTSDWRFMSRSYGAVWTTSQTPAGPLQLRMVVTGGYDGKWVWAEREVLPAQWKVGAVYDTGVQISDVAQEGCGACDVGEWM